MSYLGSLLASYGVGEEKPNNPASETSMPVVKRNTTTTPASSTRPAMSLGTKRKAEDSVGPGSLKIHKPLPAGGSTAKMISQSGSVLARRDQRPSEKSRLANINNGTIANVSSVKAQPTSAPVAAAAPPRGSFAELMARAKMIQQSKLGQGTKIMHKATPRDDPKDRKKELDPKLRGKAIVKGKPVSRSSSEGPGKMVKPNISKSSIRPGKIAPEKPRRKPIEVSYKGTMRPNTTTQPAHRAASNLKASVNPVRNDGYPYDRYGRHYNDDENEDDEEYDSAVSSDMEAGAWDIDEEEDFALRNAKAEDAAAKREEEEHKRRKLLLKQGISQGSTRRRY